MGAGQVDGGVGQHACGLDDLVAGGLEGDAEAGPVRVGAGDGPGGVADRDPDHLVDGQQGVDLLGDAGMVRARRTRRPSMVFLIAK